MHNEKDVVAEIIDFGGVDKLADAILDGQMVEIEITRQELSMFLSPLTKNV